MIITPLRRLHSVVTGLSIFLRHIYLHRTNTCANKGNYMLELITQNNDTRLSVENYFIKRETIVGKPTWFICTTRGKETLYLGQYNSENIARTVFGEMCIAEEKQETERRVSGIFKLYRLSDLK